MDFKNQLFLSCYHNITALNEEHHVYLVRHKETDKLYVRKFLTRYNLSVFQSLKDHPITGVPRIIELQETNNILTVVEEYISGDTLQDKIDSGCLSETAIHHYISELCTILQKLHSLNPPVIHRDIKPSNIVITAYDHVVLLDFNIAKYYTEGQISDTALLGTQGYAAPEQYGFGSSSPQTDIYAIGILLGTLNTSLSVPSHKFDSVIDTCTQLDPARRFSSVTQLQKKLSRLSISEPDENSSTYTKKRFSILPPGFRTLTPWHMLIAIPVYLMVFWLSLTLTSKTVSSFSALIAERIFTLLIFLSVIAGSCNYMCIQKFIPLCSSSNRLAKLIGILLLDFALVFILLLLMVMVSNLLA